MKKFGMFLVLLGLCTFTFTGCAKKVEKKPMTPPVETTPADDDPADETPAADAPAAPAAPVADPNG
jgi:hypothetical protein